MFARLLLVLAMLVCAAGTAGAFEVLSPEEALARQQAGALVIVDVRTPPEWKQTGLPAGAVGLALQAPDLKPRPGFPADMEVLLGAKDRPVALICRTGGRSSFAARWLESLGFSRVYNIAEGVAGGPNGPGWLRRGLPTTPCGDCRAPGWPGF